MMNLPKLRGAKFLEDQSIPSAKYELTSELKKMPNFSVLLLLTWCQLAAYCQIKSKTRYISFFFLCDGWLFWRLFVGQCYLRSSFCWEMRFSPEGRRVPQHNAILFKNDDTKYQLHNVQRCRFLDL